MEKPSVHVHVITFNEEVILPYFIKHYLTFCDRIYIYDNYSTDNTCEIASKYDNVFVEKFDTNNKINEHVYLNIKNECWKKDRADLAIVCDADEFLYHPNMTRFLKRFISSGYTISKPYGYDMFSEKNPSTSGQIYDEIKMGQRRPDYDKILLFNPNKITDINYDPGCHVALPEGEVKLYRNDQTLKLLHFKTLGLDYILQRHRLYYSRLSDENLKNKWGIQYFPEYEDKIITNFNEQVCNGELLNI